MNAGAGPPRLWRGLLSRVLGRDHGEFVLGDLEEDYGRVAERHGRRAADRWYRRQALTTLWAWVRRRPRERADADGRRAAMAAARTMGTGGGDGMVKDLRYAVRGMLRTPGFTALVVVTLALGIGANTAIFSVVNGVLIRALPYPDADRLVDVAERVGEASTGRVPTSLLTYRDVRESTTAFESLAAASPYQTVVLTGREDALRIRASLITPGYFDMLDARPRLGRLLRPDEGESLAGDHMVAVLSEGFWDRAFARDPAVVGGTVTLSGTPYTVVGVLDGSFQDVFVGGQPVDVYLPITEMARLVGPDVLTRRLSRQVQVLGRLRPDRSLAQAAAELDAAMAGIRAAEPAAMGEARMLVQTLRARLVGGLDGPLLALLAGAAFLLVVACINVASLMLVRGAARAREVAIRLAVGAPRARLIRQLTAEALLLSVLGGVGGVVLASLTLDLILELNASAMPAWAVVELNATVLAASLGLSLLTGLAFGLAPAFLATRSDLRSTLTRGDARSGGGRATGGRQALVVLEVATAMVLMVGSGLMIRSFQAMADTDMGFATDGILSAMTELPPDTYGEPEMALAFREAVLAELSRRPGIAWAHTWGPNRPGNVGVYNTLLAEGMTAESQLDSPLGRMHFVEPGGMAALEIPLVAGRAFTADDRAGSQPVVIISEGLARTLFGNADPVGRSVHHFTAPGDEGMFPDFEVVGVAADAEMGGRNMSGIFDVPHDMYFPVAQRNRNFQRSVVFLLGTTGDPADAAPVLRDAVRAVDSDAPLFSVAPLREMVDQELVTSRFVAVLMGVFGALSLFLAALGIYGVLAQSVSARRREVGLRSALGAGRADTVGLFVGQGLRLTLAGVGVGLAASLLLTRFVSSLLYGVAPNDPMTLATTAAMLLGVAALAAWLPTRRALRVSPMVALRSD